MNFDTIARKCRTQAYEGKSYDEIIETIPFEKLSTNEQKELRSLIDDFIVQYNLANQVKNKHRTQIMLGAVLTMVGIFIIIFTYLRHENQYTIGLAAILTGLYFTKKGYNQYKQPVDIQSVAPEKESIFHRY